jgi:hypothetical protein
MMCRLIGDALSSFLARGMVGQLLTNYEDREYGVFSFSLAQLVEFELR